ncbi:hypothetical protein SCA6_000950 [Theobroma cacao]
MRVAIPQKRFKIKRPLTLSTTQIPHDQLEVLHMFSVYTQILKGSDEVDWQQIKDNLDQSSHQSCDLGKLGYSSEAVIDKKKPCSITQGNTQASCLSCRLCLW